MGSSSSTAAPEGRPRSFYLVMGGPSIQYTAGPATSGPLIFDVELEKPEDEDAIERAEVFNMAVSVLPKEPFRIKHVQSANNRADFLFSFTISAANNTVGPHYTLRVFCGADIEYKENEGIRISQGEKSQTPFCVYETSAPEEILGEVKVSGGLQLQKLQNAVTTANEEGTKRVTYAPIVIELSYDPPAMHARRRAPAADSINTGASQRVVQYTLLDLPSDASDLVAAALRRGEDRQKPNVVEGVVPVVRQFLQLGVEVYELEDVFDLAAGDEDGDSDDEDDKLCVVCITNQRDTVLLPCRHMCLCYECASMLRIQRNNACPICRVAIERIMTA
uniref:RING-type domain-containing protein n=1 Tax=Trypanosoma congolense (strain IL3000) TaxID=1068625 RepID=G0US57_TRYCI|nr:conserved hypothetical protein [Trypanosoma congolense IL3000]